MVAWVLGGLLESSERENFSTNLSPDGRVCHGVLHHQQRPVGALVEEMPVSGGSTPLEMLSKAAFPARMLGFWDWVPPPSEHFASSSHVHLYVRAALPWPLCWKPFLLSCQSCGVLDLMETVEALGSSLPSSQ